MNVESWKKATKASKHTPQIMYAGCWSKDCWGGGRAKLRLFHVRIFYKVEGLQVWEEKEKLSLSRTVFCSPVL